VEGDDEEKLRSIVTDEELFVSARNLSPRGTTPEPTVIPADQIPEAQLARTTAEEYTELISRGATPQMCATYELEFTHEEGIVLWADDRVFDHFSGPAIKEGDFWKIYIGHAINLGPDDTDGWLFIQDLLEEALVAHSAGKHAWVTYGETHGVWATRPLTGPQDDTSDAELDDFWDDVTEDNNIVDAVTANEYEDSNSDGEEDPMLTLHEDEEFDSEGSSDVSGWDSEGPEDNVVLVVEGKRGDTIILDSEVDSDFDEDEILSGDEIFSMMANKAEEREVE
jgi:hypothetical protein